MFPTKEEVDIVNPACVNCNKQSAYFFLYCPYCNKLKHIKNAVKENPK